MQLLSRKEAIEQGLTHYFTGKPCPHGHVAHRFVISYGCTACVKQHYESRRKEKPELYAAATRKYYKSNREKCIAASIAIMKKNPDRTKKFKAEEQKRNSEKYKERSAKWYANNRSTAIKRSREWRIENSERSQLYFREYRKERLASDPDFRMRMAISAITRRVFQAVKTEKLNSTERLVGYSGADLRAHLERNFADGMSWENYGKAWQIDHVVSVMEMMKLGIKDVKMINALSNLMPEFTEVNQSKGARFALSSKPI